MIFCYDIDGLEDNKDRLLSEEVFKIYSQCMYHATYEGFQAKMGRYLADPAVKVFAHEESDKIIAILVIFVSGDTAEIIGIAVSDKYQRKGIGKQLLQKMIKSEKPENIKAQTDDDSIGFYRKCGFTEERAEITYPDGVAVRYNCVWQKRSNNNG